MQLGAKHVESPFIEFGQISTVLYFGHFVFIVPLVSLLENTLIDLSFSDKIKSNIKLESNINLESNVGSIAYAHKNFLILLLIF